jgi:hypothetical protein
MCRHLRENFLGHNVLMENNLGHLSLSYHETPFAEGVVKEGDRRHIWDSPGVTDHFSDYVRCVLALPGSHHSSATQLQVLATF